MENLQTKQNMREPTNAIYPLKRDENVFIEDNIPLKLYIYSYKKMSLVLIKRP